MAPSLRLRRTSTAKLDPLLNALREDPDAVRALALAYEILGAEERQQWLERLAAEGIKTTPKMGAPPSTVALYAPLLAVETDEHRRAVIIEAITVCPESDISASANGPRALRGSLPSARLAVLVLPLYLNFVQVLVCTYRPRECIVSVWHEPIVATQSAPRADDLCEGVRLSDTPVTAVVDELAAAIVAHVRSGLQLPDALKVLADLFGVREEPLPAV